MASSVASIVAITNFALAGFGPQSEIATAAFFYLGTGLNSLALALLPKVFFEKMTLRGGNLHESPLHGSAAVLSAIGFGCYFIAAFLWTASIVQQQ
jgi:hypothetical protein